MANLNENDAIDRVKRGSLKFELYSKHISATKESFIKAQIKTLYKDVTDVHNRGKIANKLRHSYFTSFFDSHQSASLLKYVCSFLILYDVFLNCDKTIG